MQGVIKRLVHDRCYGFVTSPEHHNLFFHVSALREAGIHTLDAVAEGQRVEYEPGTTRDGRPAALTVRPLNDRTTVRGTVYRIEEGKPFGFLVDDATGQQRFFHRSSCPAIFDQLRPGTPVTFTPVDSEEKGPRAEDLRLA